MWNNAGMQGRGYYRRRSAGYALLRSQAFRPGPGLTSGLQRGALVVLWMSCVGPLSELESPVSPVPLEFGKTLGTPLAGWLDGWG